MDHYFDIQLKPDAEMQENLLMDKVYTKLHKALYTLNSNTIGVSFPERKLKLGNLLRIHGFSNKLEELIELNWLGGLTGYCSISEIKKVPVVSGYVNVSRVQTTMSNAKLRRLKNRGSISNEETKKYIAKMFSNGLVEPYLTLESASNGYKHRRYIAVSEIQIKPIEGEFDVFGLSKTATVPFF